MPITEFTPYASLIGGAIIGLSAVLLMAGSGRIAGCTGIFRNLLSLNFNGEYKWRAMFTAGLILGPLLVLLVMPTEIKSPNFAPLVPTIIGGLLVGFGTTLANGCTSGHGICGLARFSTRSLAAVISFMATGIATVYIIRHVMGA